MMKWMKWMNDERSEYPLETHQWHKDTHSRIEQFVWLKL
jgi:hypothetical protein